MSVTVKLLSNGESQWDEFVKAHPEATFFHQYKWLKLVEEVCGGEPFYLAAFEGDDIVGVLPLMFRKVIGDGRVLISVPFADEGGVCAASEEAEGELLRAAEELGKEVAAAYVELRQLREIKRDGLLCDLSRVILRMPLPDDSEELWRSFSSDMRRKIRRSQRGGLQATTAGPEALGEFYAVYSQNMRDLGSPMQSFEFFRRLAEVWPEETLVVIVRNEEGKPVGTALAVQFRDVLTVLCPHSLRRYFKLFPNNLLYWHVLQEAIKRGCRIADFGRSPRGSGAYNFKKQWGMEDCQLYRTYLPIRQVPSLRERRDSRAYRVFSAIWRRVPLPLARTVGPWLFKRLPV